MHRLLVSHCFLLGSLSASAQQVTVLPLQQARDLPYVTCSIADSGPLHCLLDTGSAMTAISASLAARLKLKTHVDASIPRPDLAGQMPDEQLIYAGDASWTAQRVSIAPKELAQLDRETGGGFHTDVVLGTSLLEHFQVTINPLRKEVRLAVPGTPPPDGMEKLPSSMQRIPFTILLVKTKDGHAAAAPFSMDTRSRPALMLSHNFWASRPQLATSDVIGPEGERFILDAIRLGHATLDHVNVLEPLHEAGLVASKTVGGVLGAPTLNQFIITYDLPQNNVWIKPVRSVTPKAASAEKP